MIDNRIRHGCLVFVGILWASAHGLWAQNLTEYFKDISFTRADTLRGALSPVRTCYDVKQYDVRLQLDIPAQSIVGQQTMTAEATTDFSILQLDLAYALWIDSLVFAQQRVPFVREGNAFFVHLPDTLRKGTRFSLAIYYHGQPQIAANAPWDGGFVWAQDPEGNPWLGVACEGLGASSWYPCKDHLSDEADTTTLTLTIPDTLQFIGNGRQISDAKHGDWRTTTWRVHYPINTYNLTFYVGKFAHFSDIYISPTSHDTLTLAYFPLRANLAKAKTHFAQVKPMLACYETYFGKFPFWNDGYKLVESPYLGMEHQSGIAYGNGYQRGYKGGMIPEDMQWDFIIVHESGHEYWGNWVSCNDHADMWIHEAFTTYAEAVYVECTAGYADGVRHLENYKKLIRNHDPLVGLRDVNFNHWVGSDMYFKGAWVLHSLRNFIADDALWWQLLRAMPAHFGMQTCQTTDIIAYINAFTKRDFSRFFAQYLYHPKPPRLLYQVQSLPQGSQISLQWLCEVKGFDMPIYVIFADGTRARVAVQDTWQTHTFAKPLHPTTPLATEMAYFTPVPKY